MRLFVAAEVPERQRASLAGALDSVRALVPGARWSSPESWHVTLKFLGEVSEAQLDEVQEVLEDVVSRGGAFHTRLTEAGAFPSVRRPRVLWIGLADEQHAFRDLAGRMERKFEKAGFPGDGRPFRPHLTLARFRDPTRSGRSEPAKPADASSVPRFIEKLSGQTIDRSSFVISELVLFQSKLTSKGAVYEPQMRLALRPQ